MGALTSKESAFDLRNWDGESAISIDITDSIGAKTRVFLKNKNVILVEPFFDAFSRRVWITDRSRHLYLLKKKNKKSKQNLNFLSSAFFKKAMVLIYFSERSQSFFFKKKNYKFFNIILDNNNLEIMSVFKIICKKASYFFKIKKSDNTHLNNAFEFGYQVNNSLNLTKTLNNSNFCLSIACNLRYEGYYFNINLKKRVSRGFFKYVSIGSKISSTVSSLQLGSISTIIKSTSLGKNLLCKALKTEKNPIIILNSHFFKTINKEAFNVLSRIFTHSAILSKHWLGLNTLTSNLSENNQNNATKIEPFTKKDFLQSKALYLININMNNTKLIKNLLQTFLIKKNYMTPFKKKTMFLQNHTEACFHLFKNNYNANIHHDILHTSSSHFYENEEMHLSSDGYFLNTEKVTAVDYINKIENAWLITRHFLNFLNNFFFIKNLKINQTITFVGSSLKKFKNYIHFLDYATINITNLSFFLQKKTVPFFFFKNIIFFKKKRLKFKNYKHTYWMHDFFIGGKDEYSIDSMLMIKCAVNLRFLNSTFF